MKPSTLFIFLVVSTCHYTTAETILEKGKEKVQAGAESVKETVKGTVNEWSDKAQEMWEKSGTAFRDASQSVRAGIKSITPEFLQAAEPESKLQEWKSKLSNNALKELDDAATLLEEANNQVKDIMTQGGADAKAKMTRLRLSVDHAVRHSMKAFKSLHDEANKEGVPQTLVDRLKQGWTATTSGVESLKDFVFNAYKKEEDKHEIVQDLDATFKQWEKFKAAASEKLEAAKEIAGNKLLATKDAASEKLEAAKEVAGDKLHAAKEATMDAAHTAKDATMDAAHSAKEMASDKLHTAKDATMDAAHSAKETAGEKLHAAKESAREMASDKLQAAKDAVNGGEL